VSVTGSGKNSRGQPTYRDGLPSVIQSLFFKCKTDSDVIYGDSPLHELRMQNDMKTNSNALQSPAGPQHLDIATVVTSAHSKKPNK